MIDSFKDKYAFLSNFYPAKVQWEGRTFATTEHAFQAAKMTEIEKILQIQAAPTPGKAKRLGRLGKIRPDWGKVKIEVMASLLYQKFSDPLLKEMLLSTGDEELLEGNTWGDRFWGCELSDLGVWVGENYLGKLLMQTRKALRDG